MRRIYAVFLDKIPLSLISRWWGSGCERDWSLDELPSSPPPNPHITSPRVHGAPVKVKPGLWNNVVWTEDPPSIFEVTFPGSIDLRRRALVSSIALKSYFLSEKRLAIFPPDRDLSRGDKTKVVIPTKRSIEFVKELYRLRQSFLSVLECRSIFRNVNKMLQ